MAKNRPEEGTAIAFTALECSARCATRDPRGRQGVRSREQDGGPEDGINGGVEEEEEEEKEEGERPDDDCSSIDDDAATAMADSALAAATAAAGTP